MHNDNSRYIGDFNPLTIEEVQAEGLYQAGSFSVDGPSTVAHWLCDLIDQHGLGTALAVTVALSGDLDGGGRDALLAALLDL